MRAKMIAVIAVTGALLVGRGVWAHEHDEATAVKDDIVTVTGEVVDMACYIDHGAVGAKHAACAKTCIESGLPVGIRTGEGKTFLLIGEHKPLNKELAQYAAKTITVKGKLVSRDGICMIANAEIVGEGAAPATAGVKYTCSMCGGTFEKAGKCPGCGMNLVEKK